MLKASRLRTIAVDMTGNNATEVLGKLPVSQDYGLIHVKRLQVMDQSRIGTTFTYNGETKPVLANDDIAKITLNLWPNNTANSVEEMEDKPALMDLPAAALIQENDKQMYYCDIWIDFMLSEVNLQTALTGTPGWLIIEFEEFEN